MNERTLLRISLLVSLSGIVLLAMLLNVATIEEKSISEMKFVEEGRSVRIKGFVESVQNNEGYAVIHVAELKTVQVIVFDSGEIILEENENVEVIGKIRNYKGRNEIIADSIKKT